jgi:23S rRNA (guanosine2251-2'-O)-methyltransferase
VSDSTDYQEKKAFFDRVLTVYGRNPVLDALRDTTLVCYSIHLADSNRDNAAIAEIKRIAQVRDIPLKFHSRTELARISKNGKQDQGVAADIVCPGFMSLQDFLDTLDNNKPCRLLALDGITNPQNLGMIIRSAAAGNIDGIIWSKRGNAALGPLVVKASVGTLYRAPILSCQDLPGSLQDCRNKGIDVYTLEADASESLFAGTGAKQAVYVLGNESEGVSKAVSKVANRALSIPMNNGVESLNVAVAASLIAYAQGLSRD